MAAIDDLINKIADADLRARITAESVRESGLLKNRIIIVHPQDMQKYNDMAVLDKATDEWLEKCKHWRQYCTQQHYKQVEPTFIIQVQAGSSAVISHTDLTDIVAHLEKRIGRKFNPGEVVHTFGSTGDIEIAGLKIFHVEPEDIADNRKIKVVLFKENLSTGWDCPRAETIMSFRTAEDTTYIAQLLGRMVRTPLQNKILVDDYLNDVRLFLPYFNQDNVAKVVAELQSSEVDDIPTFVDDEEIENPTYVSWHVRPRIAPTAPTAQENPTLFPTDENVLPPAPIVTPTNRDDAEAEPQTTPPDKRKTSLSETLAPTAIENNGTQNIPQTPNANENGGAQVQNVSEKDLFIASDEILDPQLAVANAKMGNFGLAQHYARYYWDDNEPNVYKIDCILFAASEECLDELNAYAKEKLLS